MKIMPTLRPILRSTLLLCVLLLMLPTLTVYAASPSQVVPPVDVGAFLQAVFGVLTSMVGFPAALGTILALLMKLFPTVVTDVVAKWVSFAANIVMFAVIGWLALTGGLAWVTTIDNAFGGLNKLLLDVLVIVGGFGISFLSTPKYARAVAEHGAGFRAARMLLQPK